MTPLEAMNEFLKSPLGVYVGIIFAAFATYIASLLKQRGDTKSRQRLQTERDDEANKNIAAIRGIAVDALNRTKQLEQDKDALEAAARAATASAEAARVSEKAAKDAELSAKSRIDSLQTNLTAAEGRLMTTEGNLADTQKELKAAQETLTTRQAESKKNADEISALHYEVNTLREQFNNVEGERDAALTLVKSRDLQLAARDRELQEREQRIVLLEQRQGENEKEIERLNLRVAELEKRKTGPLPELPTTPVE